MKIQTKVEVALEKLKTCSVVIADATNVLEQALNGTLEEPDLTQDIIKLEDVRAVLAEKSRDGKTAQVKELISSYGAEKLSDINPNSFPELIAKAGEL